MKSNNRMFTSPGEIAFHIGSFPIHYYGIIMALAILTGIFVTVFITKKYYPDINPDVVYEIYPWIIIGAILGARLYYCILSYGYYAQNPIEILQLWQGGLSIHGALLGGLITGIIYAKRHKLPILRLCDIFSYGLVLGQTIGRWGNFFNSEAFGLPTQNFLKLYIPLYKRPIDYMQYSYFQPTFLYESILNFCILLILFFVIRKIIKGKDGTVFFSYLILYSIVRIFVEQLRVDSVLNIYGIPVAQIVSILIILVSVIFLLKINKVQKPAP